METFSALLAICAGNSPVTGEFPTQRPVTRGFAVFPDLRLNERLLLLPSCMKTLWHGSAFHIACLSTVVGESDCHRWLLVKKGQICLDDLVIFHMNKLLSKQLSCWWFFYTMTFVWFHYYGCEGFVIHYTNTCMPLVNHCEYVIRCRLNYKKTSPTYYSFSSKWMQTLVQTHTP